MLYFQTDTFGALNDLATIEATPHANRCSPIRVLEDGNPLAGPNASCEVVTRQGLGRTCHTPDKLFFTTSDNTSPYTTEPERAYQLTLDPDRTCDAALWLYPGDKAKVMLVPTNLATTNRGIGDADRGRHRLRGIKEGDDLNAVVTVRVRAGNQVRPKPQCRSRPSRDEEPRSASIPGSRPAPTRSASRSSTTRSTSCCSRPSGSPTAGAADYRITATSCRATASNRPDGVNSCDSWSE